MKNLILIILVAFTLLLGSILYKDFHTKNTLTSQNVSQQTENMEINITKPFLTSSKNGFNTYAQSLISAQLQQFVTSVSAINPSIQKQIKAPSSLHITYKQNVFIPGEVISIQLVIHSYIKGSAHPSQQIRVINYSLRKNRPLQLADLFKKNSNYLITIADFCKKTLEKRDLGPVNFIDQGTKAIPENYNHWSITKKGILIHFNPAQVAPRVYGAQDVVIPFDQLEAYQF